MSVKWTRRSAVRRSSGVRAGVVRLVVVLVEPNGSGAGSAAATTVVDAVRPELQPSRVEQVPRWLAAGGNEVRTPSVSTGPARRRHGARGDAGRVGAGRRLGQGEPGDLAGGDPAQQQVARLARRPSSRVLDRLLAGRLPLGQRFSDVLRMAGKSRA